MPAGHCEAVLRVCVCDYDGDVVCARRGLTVGAFLSGHSPNPASLFKVLARRGLGGTDSVGCIALGDTSAMASLKKGWIRLISATS